MQHTFASTGNIPYLRNKIIKKKKKNSEQKSSTPIYQLGFQACCINSLPIRESSSVEQQVPAVHNNSHG